MAEMRRADRKICDDEEMRDLFERCHVLRVGFADAEGPFIVPVNYGFNWRGLADAFPVTLYAHSALQGRKARAIARGGRVAVEMDEPLGVMPGRTACAHSFAYRSIMGAGEVRTVTDDAEKRAALRLIMDRETGSAAWDIPQAALDRVLVWAVDVGELSGKAHA